jgi:hypothetical protein
MTRLRVCTGLSCLLWRKKMCRHYTRFSPFSSQFFVSKSR